MTCIVLFRLFWWDVIFLRADRLLSILLLLQNRGKLTTKELADELEVTPRTIQRDMEALCASGIPLVADRGKMGGWYLIDQYKTHLTGLKPDEIKSLFLSPSPQVLSDLNLTDEWSKARQKLQASMSSLLDKKHINIENRIHIDTSTWRDAPNNITTSIKTLQQALFNEKKLMIDYEKGDGIRGERLVDPLGLVAKGNTWYLIARSNNEFRNFKVNRILHMRNTEEKFDRPVPFDLATYWEDSKKHFVKSLPKYEVTVEISPMILRRITFTGRFVHNIKLEAPLPNGWIPASFCFDSEEEAVAYLLGFGTKIKIVSPKILKDLVYHSAKEIVDEYCARTNP
jgi:predicted DNA-binding transcriptional regulator YafY